jgi:hypothetical protein
MPNEEMGGRARPEPPGVATGLVLISVASFLGLVGVAMAVLFFYLRAGAPDALEQAVENPFPTPALQTTPQDDLKQFQREQRMALSGYGWVDRSKDIARIPIEEAMRIIAARGDHGYDPLDPPTDASKAGDQGGARP